MAYIAKAPIHVLEKERRETEYKLYSKYKGYAYLAVNGNRIDFNIIMSSKKETLKISIARHYLYDMLMFSLMFRKIPRQSHKEDKLWLHPGIRTLKREKDFNQMLPDEMRETFENALGSLGDIVKKSPEKEQISARIHFDKLVVRAWKADLMSELYNANKFIEKVKKI